MPKKSSQVHRFYPPEKWQKIIEDWKKSNLTISRFCQEYGYTESTFWNWKKKLEDSDPSSNEKKKPRRAPRFYTVKEWEAIIEERKKSELSEDEFCRKHNIGATALFNWKKKLSDPELSRQAYEREKSNMVCRYSLEQWRAFINEWRQSGLGKDPFCRKKNLTPSAFYSWLQKIEALESSQNKKTNTSSQTPQLKSSIQERFIPVTLKQDTIPLTPSTDSSKIEVTLSQGHKLLIQGSLDWDSVMTLLTPLLTQ